MPDQDVKPEEEPTAQGKSLDGSSIKNLIISDDDKKNLIAAIKIMLALLCFSSVFSAILIFDPTGTVKKRVYPEIAYNLLNTKDFYGNLISALGDDPDSFSRIADRVAKKLPIDITQRVVLEIAKKMKPLERSIYCTPFRDEEKGGCQPCRKGEPESDCSQIMFARRDVFHDDVTYDLETSGDFHILSCQEFPERTSEEWRKPATEKVEVTERDDNDTDAQFDSFVSSNVDYKLSYRNPHTGPRFQVKKKPGISKVDLSMIEFEIRCSGWYVEQ